MGIDQWCTGTKLTIFYSGKGGKEEQFQANAYQRNFDEKTTQMEI